MSSVILTALKQPKDDPMLLLAKEVDEICKPLRSLNITHFGYVRIYNDGSRFDINNNAEFSEAYYYKTNCYQLYTPEMDPSSLKDGFVFASAGIIDQHKLLHELTQSFSIGNVMLLVQNHVNYCELWHFGAHPNMHGMVNVYLNNLDLLKAFCFYFKDKGAKIIKTFEKNRIRVEKKPANIIHTIDNLTVRENCLQHLDIEKYHLGEIYENHYITKREAECIKWCIQGKTAGEIAAILNITERTVNAHLDNVKRKLNCYKQSILTRRIIDLGIIDAL